MAQIAQRPITGVVTGQLGIGKSTLINNLLRNDMTEPADRAKIRSVFEDLESGTKRVQLFYGSEINNYMNIFDTPGCSATTITDEAIIEEIYRKTEGKVDFLYYCISARNDVAKSDRKMFKLLTSNFKKKIWNHTIFVITFCNEMGGETPKDFEEKMLSYRNDIRSALAHCGIPHDETQDILIVPAGNKSPCIWQQGGRRSSWTEYLREMTRERIDSTHTLLKRSTKCNVL